MKSSLTKTGLLKLNYYLLALSLVMTAAVSARAEKFSDCQLQGGDEAALMLAPKTLNYAEADGWTLKADKRTIAQYASSNEDIPGFYAETTSRVTVEKKAYGRRGLGIELKEVYEFNISRCDDGIGSATYGFTVLSTSTNQPLWYLGRKGLATYECKCGID